MKQAERLGRTMLGMESRRTLLGRRRLSGTIALVAAAALALPAAAQASGANVRGTVFDDYGELGVQHTNPATGQIDNGLKGIKVRAYDRANKLVGTATTNAKGDYRLGGLPVGQIRVEVEIPSPYQISPDRTSAGGTVAGATPNASSRLDSNERYLSDAHSPSGVNFGLEIPDQYSVANPRVYSSVMWPLPPAELSGIDASAFPAINEYSYFNPGAGTTLADYSQVGSINGLAVNQGNGDVFAGAFYSTASVLMPAGAYPGLTYPTGAIYRVVPNSSGSGGAVHLFADVNAGAAPSSTATIDEIWPHVGHEGWGALAIDPAGQNLYAVSLYNHSLYRFPLRGGTVNATGQVQPARITSIPDPGCAGGDWAPWGLSFDPRTGALYLGGTCTAATSQNPGNLHAYVMLIKAPSSTPKFSKAMSFGLGYNRLDHNSQAYPSGSGTTDPHQSNWEPWPTVASVPPGTYTGGPSDSTRGTRSTPYGPVYKYDESYPAMSQIAFDASGNLIVAFRDLMGDMSAGEGTYPQGDLLKACRSGKSGWKLESAGSCGGVKGFLPTVNGVPVSGGHHGVDNAVFGPIGLGGGHFFDPNDVTNESQPDTSTTRDGEADPQFGSVLDVAGFPDVVNAQNEPAQHPVDSANYSNLGVVWDSDFTGDFSRASQPVGGGKATSLGNLAAFTGEAPVEIGNRVWRDLRSTCTEDAGDPGIRGVVVNLLARGGADLATATTDGAGQYTFSILRGTRYTLAIKLHQGPLKRLVPTCANRRGVNSRITSKGVVDKGLDTAHVAPLAAGHNDFNYDFGFRRRAVKPARKHRRPPPPRFTG